MSILRKGSARTHEEVICFWTRPTDLEQLHHVPELPVYVSAYLPSYVIHRVRPSTRVDGGHTVTGESTTCTFASSISISRALMHSRLTCSSEMGSHRRSCSICLPRVEAEWRARDREEHDDKLVKVTWHRPAWLRGKLRGEWVSGTIACR